MIMARERINCRLTRWCEKEGKNQEKRDRSTHVAGERAETDTAEAGLRKAERDLIGLWGGPMVPAAIGGRGEPSVLSLKRDRLFGRGARAVASRGLYLPVEGYWFSNSLHHTPQVARENNVNTNGQTKENVRKRDGGNRKREREEKERGRVWERETEKTG